MFKGSSIKGRLDYGIIKISIICFRVYFKICRERKRGAKATINHILKMSNITDEIFEEAVANLKSHARIALHFHPDRLDSSKKSVAEALFEQGVYKSQFETLLSNGSVSAYPGGERDLWERRIFGGAYQLEGVTNEQRPKYGALNLMLHPDGPLRVLVPVIFSYLQKFLRVLHIHI